MLHETFGGFHQVGNQIVATLQLHIDLCEGVFVAVAEFHQAVVEADHEDHR